MTYKPPKYVVIHFDDDIFDYWVFGSFRDALNLYDRIAVEEYAIKKYDDVRRLMVLGRSDLKDKILNAVCGVEKYEVMICDGIKIRCRDRRTGDEEIRIIGKALVKIWR